MRALMRILVPRRLGDAATGPTQATRGSAIVVLQFRRSGSGARSGDARARVRETRAGDNCIFLTREWVAARRQEIDIPRTAPGRKTRPALRRPRLHRTASA